MCDDLTNLDQEAFLVNAGISRRKFGKLGAGVALATMLPPVANAQDVVEQDVLIDMDGGKEGGNKADAYFVHPSEGRYAAVIVWPDIMGIRPAFRSMGKRLAQSGYAVLVVNPYYRTVKGQVTPDGGSFADPEVRAILLPYARTLSHQTAVADGRDFVRFLDAQAVVDTKRKIGTTGYCMTGSYPLLLAADQPDRIGAGGSFHSGALVQEAEDSPHLLIPKISASMLIAIAENDHERRPDEKGILEASFKAANVDAEIEVYEGAMHGWCPPDSRVYNEVMAEKAWARMLALFEKRLA